MSSYTHWLRKMITEKIKYKTSQKIYLVFKRVIGALLAAIGLVVLSPLMLITAIAVKLDSKGPVFFKQMRLGVDGVPFEMYKFRSMCVGAEHTGSGVYSDNNDPRITKVGNILRKTSIDELPQMINILKGNMAWIGPRPALTYHPWNYEEYTEHQKHMFDLRPGITGWAQINGRKEVPWPERIELNIWYVQHVSLWLDIKIIFMTVLKVLTNAGNENIGETAPVANSGEAND